MPGRVLSIIISVNGTMPVVIDASVTNAERSLIVDQMNRFNQEMSGCLQFV